MRTRTGSERDLNKLANSLVSIGGIISAYPYMSTKTIIIANTLFLHLISYCYIPLSISYDKVLDLGPISKVYTVHHWRLGLCH